MRDYDDGRLKNTPTGEAARDEKLRTAIVMAWDTAERIATTAQERRLTVVAGQSAEGELRLGAADDERQWLQSGDVVDLGGWA